MLEQERRKQLHIILHCIADSIRTWRPSSSHGRFCRRMQMLLELFLSAVSYLHQKLLPILVEVDKCYNRKGENDSAFYRTVQLTAYLLGGLLVHTVVFAIGCRCSWDQLSLLYELFNRSCCPFQQRQINVDFFSRLRALSSVS